MTFEQYFLDADILDALREMEFVKPTPIQEKTIPRILEGKDLIALAETGSGKTAACAIPVCHQIDLQSSSIQALIMVPTRELALQYATETQKIGKYKKVKIFSLLGGGDMDLQRAKLKDGVHVLIATPGRLIDFIYARAIDLHHVRLCILDEADLMLGMGFYEDLEFILHCLNHPHQTLLFSATMPDEICKLAHSHMSHPEKISLIQGKPTPMKLLHKFFFCKNVRQKVSSVITLLKRVSPKQCLIFTNSRKEAERLYQDLRAHFSSIDFLHGGLAQPLRTKIITKFSKEKIRYLIATDIAARGLDFSGISHVMNMHLPKDGKTYIHRAGRAGRSGKEGICITLVTHRDLPKVSSFLNAIQKKPIWIDSPPKPFSPKGNKSPA